ncbi:MAG: FAD-dependent oxidoreductase [Thermodesulfobacteriota bacterium]
MIKKLLEPIKVGRMSLRNRVVMTAMHLNYTPTGEVTDQFVDFYRARSKGGVGLIIIGGAGISPEACGLDAMLSIQDDRFVPGLTRVVNAIRTEGAASAVQLYHAGAYSFCAMKGIPTLAPSEYETYFTRQKTKAMTVEDIARVLDEYAAAAKRAKAAGFDAIEVIASAGYLICQFLSPKTNRREDEYGGPIENRMRFGLEVVERVRKEIGPETALIVRVAGNDFVPGCHTNTEAKLFAAAVEKAGADCVNVTGGWHESRIPQISMDLPQAGYAYLAAGIKQHVRVPVVACNRINDPFVAEEILAEGMADLVGVARGHIADPEFVNKTAAGKTAEIRRCIACNQRCFDAVFQMVPVGCVVNPRAGKEASTEILPAATPKKILVAGAGPSGCEFAAVAVDRGHKVMVCEKESHIGGQIAWAADATHKRDFHYIIEYYEGVLKNRGVDLRLGVPVTPELVRAEQPDLVVVATGAAPFKPPVPAMDLPHVVQAWDVLKGRKHTGTNVVIVGGGSVGLETALFLASKGTISPHQLYFLTLHHAESQEMLEQLVTTGVKKVTVIEMAHRMGQDIGMSTRWILLKDLRTRGVSLITGAKMKDITPESIVYTDAQGEEIAIPCDTVVLAMGSRPEASLADALKDTGVEVLKIGDANKVGRIGEAVEAGFTLGNQV